MYNKFKQKSRRSKRSRRYRKYKHTKKYGGYDNEKSDSAQNAVINTYSGMPNNFNGSLTFQLNQKEYLVTVEKSSDFGGYILNGDDEALYNFKRYCHMDINKQIQFYPDR